MGNTQQDFESYQARKYQAWKNKNSILTLEELDTENRGLRTEEQRSFEEYLKTIDGTHGANILKYNGALTYDKYVEFSNKNINWSFAKIPGLDKLQVNDYVILTSATVSDRPNMKITFFGKITSVDSNQSWIQGLGLATGIDAYSKTESDRRFLNAEVSDHIASDMNLMYDKSEYFKVTETCLNRPVNEYGIGLFLLEFNRTGVQFFYPITGAKAGTTYSRSCFRGTWGQWKEITDSSYSYSKAEIDKIVAGLTPGGGGGGSREPVIVPEDSPTIKEYEGAYGVNVINYRELSRDPRFIVNKNIITTKGQRIAHGDKGQLQDGLLLNRIRKTTWKSSTDVDKAEITFKYKILKSDSDRQTESDGLEVLFMRIPEEGDPQASDKILLQGQLNNTHSTTHDFKDSGYFKIDVGGANNKKVSGSVQLSAHYGDINPIEHNIYDQSFVFNKVNGIELLANSNNAHDVYQVNPLSHRVKKVLNRVKIKDLQFVKAHDFNNSMAGLLLKIPDDCRLYNDNNGSGYETVDQAKKSINNNLMTNNLCDLSVDEDTGGVYDRPYFIKTIVTEHIGSETFDCFFIAIDKNHADKWQEHLSETEIVYEIKSSLQGYKQIQAGGILYSLANGDSVCTHNYGEVVAGCPWFKPTSPKYDKYMITFQNSPFGYQDRTILVDEIVGMRRI